MGEAAAVAGSKPSMTYVQADTSNFREVVQRLTGPSRNDLNDGGAGKGVKRPAFKLHERRHYARTKLEIVKPAVADYGGVHHHHHHQFNFFPFPPPAASYGGGSRAEAGAPYVPSLVGTPSSIFSRLSIVEEDEQVSPGLNKKEEEKAIRERRFYLHPSPRSKQPQLLTLFPLTTPKTNIKTTHDS